MTLSQSYESTILSVDASFGFGEFGCDPDEITRTLGIPPDEVQRKGEVRLLQNGKQLVTPFSSWHIVSASPSKDVNIHLRQLLVRIAGKEDLIRLEWNPAFRNLSRGMRHLHDEFIEHPPLCRLVSTAG